jgi:hypothetical protein
MSRIAMSNRDAEVSNADNDREDTHIDSREQNKTKNADTDREDTPIEHPEKATKNQKDSRYKRQWRCRQSTWARS